LIHDDLDGVAPQVPLHLEATGVEADLAVPADGACRLAEAEDPPEVGGVDHLPRRLSQDDLRRAIGDPVLGLPACLRPMPPTLIIPHERRVPVIHPLARCAAHDRGIQHPARDGEPTFGEVLPGVPPRGG